MDNCEYLSTAVVTGAGSGIGRAVAELMVQRGYNVWAFVHRRTDEFSEAASRMSEESGAWVRPIEIDLGSDASIREAVTQVAREKTSVDVLVNAAGTVSGNALFQMTKMEDMRRVMNVNFFGPMCLTQLVSRIMIRQKGGSIVNLASITALDGDPAQLEYSASKAALIAATKKLAHELGPYGIRVNAVAPGLTDTKMLSGMSSAVEQKMLDRMVMKRRADPKEIAEAVFYLASDRASFVTGQVIRVDGGAMS